MNRLTSDYQRAVKEDEWIDRIGFGIFVVVVVVIVFIVVGSWFSIQKEEKERVSADHKMLEYVERLVVHSSLDGHQSPARIRGIICDPDLGGRWTMCQAIVELDSGPVVVTARCPLRSIHTWCAIQ